MADALPPSEDGERVGLDADELPRAKDAYRYLADPRILNRIAHLQKTASALVRDPDPLLRLGELPYHLDPVDWRTGFLNVREVELPSELFSDLKQNAPQALLRDLYRPEYEAFVWQERETLVTLDLGGVRAFAEAMAAQHRDPLPTVKPLSPEMMEHAERWRAIVREHWQPVYADTEKRKRVVVVHELSANW